MNAGWLNVIATSSIVQIRTGLCNHHTYAYIGAWFTQQFDRLLQHNERWWTSHELRWTLDWNKPTLVLEPDWTCSKQLSSLTGFDSLDKQHYKYDHGFRQLQMAYTSFTNTQPFHHLNISLFKTLSCYNAHQYAESLLDLGLYWSTCRITHLHRFTSNLRFTPLTSPPPAVSTSPLIPFAIHFCSYIHTLHISGGHHG